MAIYVVTGKLGSGKTLASVGRIRDYLMQNRRVATNLDLNLENLINAKSKKATVYRIPDNPTVADFEALGMGSDQYGEEHNGLIVLDECGQWLNTRNFQDRDRGKLINWFIHARKKRWDVIFIIQHINALDKQFRDMFAEHIVTCQRLDRLRVPVLSWLLSFIGIDLRLPKLHRAVVKYGSGQGAMTVDVWTYFGTSLYAAFNTEQLFDAETQCGIYQLLPPWYTRGRYETDWQEFARKFKQTASHIRVKTRWFFLGGLLAGGLATGWAGDKKPEQGAPAAQAATEAKQPAKPTDPLEGAFIAGSFQSATFFDYYVQNATQSIDLAALGYRTKWLEPCRAMLINDETGQTRYLRCRAARDVGDSLRPGLTDSAIQPPKLEATTIAANAISPETQKK